VLNVRRLRWRDRAAALDYLGRDAAANLMLLDAAASLGLPGGGSGALAGRISGRWPASTLAAAFEGERIRGVLAVRPSVLLDAAASAEAVEALAPQLDPVGAGLIRSPAAGVERLWAHLARAGRRAAVDRREIAHRLDLDAAAVAALPGSPALRSAREPDLEDLVIAARASLREEGRPDPFHGDPQGFRAWVHGRMARARVLEDAEGRVVFVAYADVQRPEGWLLQGVYTWPDRRRRGFARGGVAALCREAATAGAGHVQLAVVSGNAPAERLYAGLGFQPFLELRTILFQ
jgi:RimJ/RimL family protein N-acetyltransferase